MKSLIKGVVAGLALSVALSGIASAPVSYTHLTLPTKQMV